MRKKKYISHDLELQKQAFASALEYCRIYGLDWRKNMQSIIENNEIKGYRIMNENNETVTKFLI